MTSHSTSHANECASVALAFAPVHKSALGIAFGVVVGLSIFAMTAFHLILRPADGLNIALLGQYFYGFEVSWKGAFVGLAWGLATGFVIGWFLAFVRNFTMTIWVFALRTKAELAHTSGFLDHI